MAGPRYDQPNAGKMSREARSWTMFDVSGSDFCLGADAQGPGAIRRHFQHRLHTRAHKGANSSNSELPAPVFNSQGAAYSQGQNSMTLAASADRIRRRRPRKVLAAIARHAEPAASALQVASAAVLDALNKDADTAPN